MDLLSRSRRRRCNGYVRQALGISERRACRTWGQHRSTQRKVPYGKGDEERLTEDIIELARAFGGYGYRMITGMLKNGGWHVNHKRVERIWRREWLKVPEKQGKRGQLWLIDGSRVRLRPEHPNHSWWCVFVRDRTKAKVSGPVTPARRINLGPRAPLSASVKSLASPFVAPTEA